MGSFFSRNTSNTKTTENSFTNFYEVIDYIATYYILTMDFKSLSKLTEKEYCDNLIVLTSDIIKRYFTDLEVTYLEQRIKKGLEVNELTKDNIIFLNKDQLEQLDIENDAKKSIRKKRVCLGIAKYYIKIAHLYAAIMMTINPIYIYKDETGNTVRRGLLEKNLIPKNAKRVKVNVNICDNRIKALKKSETILDETIMNPEICTMNLNKDNSIKSLSDEPGIQELMQLYLDDKYDYSTGTFTGMSEETQKQFEKDLKTFYTTFTGEQEMDSNIKSFSDIKLKDATKEYKKCDSANPDFMGKYKVDKNDKLFIDYSSNIRDMINRASSKQSELLSVVNEIFTFVIDPFTKKKRIRISPILTDELLQKAVEKARKIIIELYVSCETDYVKGIHLYEAIVEKKIFESLKNQEKNLQKEKEKTIQETRDIELNSKNSKNNIIINPELNTHTQIV
uniref:Uncharacterized protein n=1 Tax=viral metagenome TaxID=1070528 RepID=A0A6C0IGE8_9ZZZZ